MVRTRWPLCEATPLPYLRLSALGKLLGGSAEYTRGRSLPRVIETCEETGEELFADLLSGGKLHYTSKDGGNRYTFSPKRSAFSEHAKVATEQLQRASFRTLFVQNSPARGQVDERLE